MNLAVPKAEQKDGLKAEQLVWKWVVKMDNRWVVQWEMKTVVQKAAWLADWKELQMADKLVEMTVGWWVSQRVVKMVVKMVVSMVVKMVDWRAEKMVAKMVERKAE